MKLYIVVTKCYHTRVSKLKIEISNTRLYNVGERSKAMSRSEFVEIYLNASEEVQSQIEETLRSYQTEPSCQPEDSRTDRKEH